MRLGPLFILTPHRHEVNHTASSRQTNERYANTVSRLVQWRVLLQEGKCGDNAANVAKTNLPGTANRPPVMAAEIQVKPTNDDWHGGVTARCHKEKCRVFQVTVLGSAQQYREPSNADGDWDQGEEEAMPQSVRRPGNQHREAEGRCPGRD